MWVFSSPPTPVHGLLARQRLLRLLLALGNYLLRNEVALEDGGHDHAGHHCKFRQGQRGGRARDAELCAEGFCDFWKEFLTFLQGDLGLLTYSFCTCTS